MSATHDIESGKWVDILQRDLNGQRTRSLDVLITRQPPEPDAKKSKIEELTIQVLMVEVESFDAGTEADGKERSRPRATAPDLRRRSCNLSDHRSVVCRVASLCLRSRRLPTQRQAPQSAEWADAANGASAAIL